MRRVLALVALVLSCAWPGSAQVETSRQLAGLRGPVRSVRVEVAKVATASAAPRQGARVLLSINSYDRNGNTIGQTVNNPDGSRKWKLGWRHTYDTQGRENRIDYYNANGVLTSTGVSVYDDKAHQAQLSQHNPNGSVNHIREIFFDDNGRMIREIFRYPNGTALDRSASYDSRGKPIEETFRDVAGNLKHKVLWSYDDHGSPIELVIEQPDGSRQQQYKKELRYDENGNAVQEVNYRTDGRPKSKETFTYEVDTQGNWTKRTTVREVFGRNGSTRETEITYRHITYF